MCRLTSSGLVAIVVGAMNHYWRLLPQSPCSLFIVLRHRMPSPPDIPLRSDTQALRLIASIPLILRREKHRSREEKSAFTQQFFRIYVRSLKDQARKSKYPRTEILEPRTQSKLICHSSRTFIPTRSNNLIQVHSTYHYWFILFASIRGQYPQLHLVFTPHSVTISSPLPSAACPKRSTDTYPISLGAKNMGRIPLESRIFAREAQYIRRNWAVMRYYI